MNSRKSVQIIISKEITAKYSWRIIHAGCAFIHNFNYFPKTLSPHTCLYLFTLSAEFYTIKSAMIYSYEFSVDKAPILSNFSSVLHSIKNYKSATVTQPHSANNTTPFLHSKYNSTMWILSYLQIYENESLTNTPKKLTSSFFQLMCLFTLRPKKTL